MLSNSTSPAQAIAHARGILFDMDGVLIDSEPVHERSIVALTAELGDALEDETIIYSFKGAPERTMADRLLQLYPGQAMTAEQLILRKIEIFTALFPEVQLVEGAMEFVQRSHAAGRKHGLTTSASRAGQALAFRTFGFDPYFNAIVTGEDIQRGKPDPEPYLLTADQLGLSPKECVVIEDSINGVRSGKAAGCVVIALTATFGREKLAEAGADYLIDSFREMDL